MITVSLACCGLLADPVCQYVCICVRYACSRECSRWILGHMDTAALSTSVGRKLWEIISLQSGMMLSLLQLLLKLIYRVGKKLREITLLYSGMMTSYIVISTATVTVCTCSVLHTNLYN